MEDTNKDKKKIKIYFSLLVTVICLIGVSYAFFQLFLKQSENNTLASRTCFDTSLTEDTEKIVLENAYPVVDSEGLKGTPFTFTLKNNCSSYIRIYITIDSEHRGNLGTSYLDDDYIKVNISPKGTTDNHSVLLGNQTLTGLDNDRKGYIIVNTGLLANEEKSYDLRLWMNQDVSLEQGLGKSWEGKIVVVSNASERPAAPDGWYEADDGTLLASLRKNNELKEAISEPGKEVSAYTKDDITDTSTSSLFSYQTNYFTYGTGWEANGSNFNLTGTAVTSDTYANSYSSLVGKYLVSQFGFDAGSSTAGTMKPTTNLSSVYYVVSATLDGFTYKEITSNKNTTEALLASTEDDYGTSYYFRGAVKNNYVEFANKCWRIVRITGDGSVKLVLHNDNTSGASNPCSSTNNSDTAAFARYSGTLFKSDINSNYDDNAYMGLMYGTAGSSDYASTHANTNKSTILTNLETWYTNNLISYESKLADTIWCNDKSTVNDYLGYGSGYTYYAAYNRLVSTKQPTLKCPNDNNGGKLSKFTVSDTMNGNGNLDYKIGLLTADEIAFSGFIYGADNRSTYLQENTGTVVWCSLSPNIFHGSYTDFWTVYSGDLGYDDELNYGLRPAVSLISGIEISSGSGTSEDPYVVK